MHPPSNLAACTFSQPHLRALVSVSNCLVTNMAHLPPASTSESDTTQNQVDGVVASDPQIEFNADAQTQSAFTLTPINLQQFSTAISDVSSANPTSHTKGRFAGRTVRVHLFERQKADRGRKFATRDRRPLDPPPVVQIQFYQVIGLGSTHETEEEIPAKDIQLEGLLCGASIHEDRDSGSEPSVKKAGEMEGDILFGSTVVQCVHLLHQGQDMLGFVFADLSVRREGLWKLHYQAFDVLHCAPGEDRHILKECVGGSFRVYPNRQFPGLPPSTDLTKTIARSGIRANHREDTRVRRKYPESKEGVSQSAQAEIEYDEAEDVEDDDPNISETTT